jgi:hypothetical protein
MGRTFVKQYGLQRTGTNAVRALLETYVPGVSVLMHVLGDKHSPPVDLPGVMHLAEGSPQPALTFVSLASVLAPAETTRLPDCAQQRDYVEAIAPELYQQVLSGGLRVVLSVREPCDWMRAAMRWRSWMPAHRRATTADMVPLVTAMCDEYNRTNRAWKELTEGHPAAAVVHYEELNGDLTPLLARLALELGLPDIPSREVHLPYSVGEADWDQQPTPLTAEPNTQRRRGHALLPTLAPAVMETLARRIDWGLAAAWGYPAPIH